MTSEQAHPAPASELGAVKAEQQPAHESPARLAFRRFGSRPAALAGLAVVAAFIVTAVLAPLLAPYAPNATSWSAIRKPPSWPHPMGTDENGRDVLSHVVFGARASMTAGVLSALIAALAGVPLGLLAGLSGGVIDAVIGRLVDAMLAVPFLILAIALAAFLGPSLTSAMIATGLAAAPAFVRVARGAAIDAATNDDVEATRAIGNPPWRVAVVHVLPNIVPPVLVQATPAVAISIVAEASLSFLGLGQQPPEASWGSMLNSAQRFKTQAPWLAVFPGVAVFLAVLAFNLTGDGLRDALDPRSRWHGSRRPPRSTMTGRTAVTAAEAHRAEPPQRRHPPNSVAARQRSHRHRSCKGCGRLVCVQVSKTSEGDAC